MSLSKHYQSLTLPPHTVADDGQVIFKLGPYFLFGSTTTASRPLITQTLLQAETDSLISTSGGVEVDVTFATLTVLPDPTFITQQGDSFRTEQDMQVRITGTLNLIKTAGSGANPDITLRTYINGVVGQEVLVSSVPPTTTPVSYDLLTNLSSGDLIKVSFLAVNNVGGVDVDSFIKIERTVS